MGAPAPAKLLIAVGGRGLRLRALGLAPRPRPGGDRSSPRSSSSSPAGRSPRERAALLATLLLLADGVYLVQSRIAMTNIFAVLFQCTAALCVLRAGLAERLSVRAHGPPGPRPGPRPLHALDEPLGRRLPGPRAPGPARRRRLLRPRELGPRRPAPSWSFPLVLYTASYVPLVVRGQLRVAGSEPNTLRSLPDLERGARDLWQEQKNVWSYHANLKRAHPYFSQW